MTNARLAILFGGSLVACLLLGLIAGRLLDRSHKHDGLEGSWEDLSYQGKSERSARMLTEADALWDAGQRPQAVTAYKTLLKAKEASTLSSAQDMPRIYRRIIEHELHYGDPGEARDWMVAALGGHWMTANRMSMDSPEGKTLMQEVAENLGKAKANRGTGGWQD